MCCCIPLRRLSYFGAAIHLMVGLTYFYFLGSVMYTMYRMRDKDKYDERVTMGLLYVGYYAAFLPPGVFIFYGVHKKIRCCLVVPSILFFFIQIYGATLEGIYKFRPQGFPEAMEKFTQEGLVINRLQADYWMDISVQLAITLSYLSMLFFYYREIEPEDTTPIQSRYAQAYLEQMAATLPSTSSSPPPPPLPHSLQHHLHQHNQPQMMQLHQQHQQQLQQQQLQQPIHHPGPPVPFRPASMQQSHPHASNTNLRGSNSTPCPPASQINLAGLNLSYEQQQQLIKLQSHPLLQQQLQQLQHQQQQALVQQLQQQHHNQQKGGGGQHIVEETEMVEMGVMRSHGHHREQQREHNREHRGEHREHRGERQQQHSEHHHVREQQQQQRHHHHHLGGGGGGVVDVGGGQDQGGGVIGPPLPLSLFQPYATMIDPIKTPKF